MPPLWWARIVQPLRVELAPGGVPYVRRDLVPGERPQVQHLDRAARAAGRRGDPAGLGSVRSRSGSRTPPTTASGRPNRVRGPGAAAAPSVAASAQCRSSRTTRSPPGVALGRLDQGTDRALHGPEPGAADRVERTHRPPARDRADPATSGRPSAGARANRPRHGHSSGTPSSGTARPVSAGTPGAGRPRPPGRRGAPILPMPGSPVTSDERPRPAAPASSSDRSTARSRARPISRPSTLALCPGPAPSLAGQAPGEVGAALDPPAQGARRGEGRRVDLDPALHRPAAP